MKRLLPALLAAAVLFSTAGCTALFDREYYTTESYQALSEIHAPEEDESPSDSISDYEALKRALTLMVEKHEESAQLQFQNYAGSISQDISTACWEVKSSTAVGAFAVDYMSYDLSRIVSYYQAEIYIAYKRSVYQMEAIEKIDSVPALAERLNGALRAGESYLVLELATAPVTADAVCGMITRAYYEDPMACPVMPLASADSYPQTGMDRIIEITINYGLDAETMVQMRQALSDACEAMLEEAVPQQPSLRQDEQIEALCAFLGGHCESSDGAGNTAYDALVAGKASSAGIAMALEAGCQKAGIDCRVVSGRLANEQHYWNIVTLDGKSYHVDASVPDPDDRNVCLMGDGTVLQAGYWWDNSEYPVCVGDFVPPSLGKENWREIDVFR